MNQTEFQAALKGLPLGRVAFFETIGSTNDEMATWAAEGAPDCSLAAANEQTAGRGRSGRGWFTPPGAGLAFSVLLRPEGLPDAAATLAAGLGALAVAEALEEIGGLKAQIKWPNDVLLNGKKVSGVLAEANWEGEVLRSLILGIGVNVTPGSVPPPEFLSLPATCVEAAAGRPVAPAALLRAILAGLLAWRPRLGTPEFIAAWEARLAYRDQPVRVISGAEELHGTLLGLATDGRLRLLGETGETRLAVAGEIRLRPEVDTPAK